MESFISQRHWNSIDLLYEALQLRGPHGTASRLESADPDSADKFLIHPQVFEFLTDVRQPRIKRIPQPIP